MGRDRGVDGYIDNIKTDSEKARDSSIMDKLVRYYFDNE